MSKYKLVIFDADGTLTPMRGSELASFKFEMHPGVCLKCLELTNDCVDIAIASNQNKRRNKKDIKRQLEWTKKQIGAKTYVYADTINFKWNPDPEMLLYLIKMFRVNKEDVLFVGDRKTDEQAAQNAGIDFEYAETFFN